MGSAIGSILRTSRNGAHSTAASSSDRSLAPCHGPTPTMRWSPSAFKTMRSRSNCSSWIRPATGKGTADDPYSMRAISYCRKPGAWPFGVIFSIELIGRLKERTPAFHAVLRKCGLFTDAAAAAAQRVASQVGPHRPIAATDADAEVPGDEVGQDAFRTLPSSVHTLFCDGL